jgi:hypothetical protein
MSVEFQFGTNAITQYRRLSYKEWEAIAEFVDNSTQAFFNYQEQLEEAFDEGECLKVDITYDRSDDGLLRVVDNSIGMDLQELRQAMVVARTPEYAGGRSRYGMGLKTAACWFGDKWEVRTSKLGEPKEYKVTVDVEEIADGNTDLPFEEREKAEEEHYTIVSITELHNEMHGRTLGKVKDYLKSMYREDLRNGILTLTWQGEELDWEGPELLVARDGDIHRKEFTFETSEGKEVRGWVGILKNGSRSRAGFSILVSGRVIKGWPDSWRPDPLFGPGEGGSNNLVNQRLVGEVHLDDFEVTHTKDDILWRGRQEEEVEEGLAEKCMDYKEFAEIPKKDRNGEQGPSDTETETALDELERELTSPEMVDKLTKSTLPPEDTVDETMNEIASDVEEAREPTHEIRIKDTVVKLFIDDDLSVRDPYVVVEATDPSKVIVIANPNHPHWRQLKGSDGVLNHLRQCVYDGVAEAKAREQSAELRPNTIKTIKDDFLRLPLEMQEYSEQPEEVEIVSDGN